jgi:hypothetical protein
MAYGFTQSHFSLQVGIRKWPFEVRGILTATPRPSSLLLVDDKMPMLVWIGNDPKEPKWVLPTLSTVRLQPVDCCPMGPIDSSEPSLASSPEAISGITKRELSTVLLYAGIKESKFIDKIVEGSSEVIDCFANQNRNLWRNWAVTRSKAKRIFSTFRIEIFLLPNGFVFLINKGIDKRFQGSKVFLCPFISSVSTIKRMVNDLRHYKSPCEVDG